jgi:predicted aldo/keto reductase-like oxidoreductase
LGGHWKRVGTALNRPFSGLGYAKEDFENLDATDLMRNRHDIVSRCIEVGINYIDACAGPEVLAYSRVLKGRRDKMYLGYSWGTKESQYSDWRTAKKLMQGLDEGLREAKLGHVDLWRITLPTNDGVPIGLDEILQVENGAVEAIEMAKKQGKARFAGVSTHNRMWLKT